MLYTLKFGNEPEPYLIDLNKPGAEEALKSWQKASGGKIIATKVKDRDNIVSLTGEGLNHCSKGLGDNALNKFKVEFSGQKHWVA